MRQFIQLILSLVTIAFMIWAIWQGYLLLIREQMELLPDHRPLVIVFSIVALIVSFMVTMAISSNGDKNLKAQQFVIRFDLYEKILTVHSQLEGEIQAETETNVEIKELEYQMLLLAPAKVLKAFNEYQNVAVNGVNSSTSKEALRKLILAMRDDLGQSNDFYTRKELQNIVK